MTQKVVKKKREAKPSRAAVVKANRLRRRQQQRIANEALGIVKPSAPLPPAPELTFHLSAFLTMAKKEYVEIRSKKTGKLFRDNKGRPLLRLEHRVFTRKVVPIKVRVKGRLVITGDRVTPWEYFPGARWTGLAEDGMFMRITAPITAWMEADMLHDLIAEDLAPDEVRGKLTRRPMRRAA